MPPPKHDLLQLHARIKAAVTSDESLGPIQVEAFPEYLELIETYRGTRSVDEVKLLPHMQSPLWLGRFLRSL